VLNVSSTTAENKELLHLINQTLTASTSSRELLELTVKLVKLGQRIQLVLQVIPSRLTTTSNIFKGEAKSDRAAELGRVSRIFNNFFVVDDDDDFDGRFHRSAGNVQKSGGAEDST